MNKSQEVLDYFWKFYDENAIEGSMLFRHYLDELKDICEKAEKYDELQTPVRLKTEMNEHNATDYRCTKCNNVVQLYDNYCSKCSQRLVAFNKE